MRFELDQTARAYDPGNPPPGPFWDWLADGCNVVGVLAFLALLYAAPFVLLSCLLP